MKFNINKNDVGKRIKNIRLDRGLTLEEFGKYLDTSKSVVYRWENGIALPNVERIKKLCKLFDITRNELLYGSVEDIITYNKNLICKELEIHQNITYDFLLMYLYEYKELKEHKEKLQNISINDINFFKKIIIILSETKKIFEKILNEKVNLLSNIKNIDEYLKTNLGLTLEDLKNETQFNQNIDFDTVIYFLTKIENILFDIDIVVDSIEVILDEKKIDDLKKIILNYNIDSLNDNFLKKSQYLYTNLENEENKNILEELLDMFITLYNHNKNIIKNAKKL